MATKRATLYHRSCRSRWTSGTIAIPLVTILLVVLCWARVVVVTAEVESERENVMVMIVSEQENDSADYDDNETVDRQLQDLMTDVPVTGGPLEPPGETEVPSPVEEVTGSPPTGGTADTSTGGGDSSGTPVVYYDSPNAPQQGASSSNMMLPAMFGMSSMQQEQQCRCETPYENLYQSGRSLVSDVPLIFDEEEEEGSDVNKDENDRALSKNDMDEYRDSQGYWIVDGIKVLPHRECVQIVAMGGSSNIFGNNRHRRLPGKMGGKMGDNGDGKMSKSTMMDGGMMMMNGGKGKGKGQGTTMPPPGKGKGKGTVMPPPGKGKETGNGMMMGMGMDDMGNGGMKMMMMTVKGGGMGTMTIPIFPCPKSMAPSPMGNPSPAMMGGPAPTGPRPPTASTEQSLAPIPPVASEAPAGPGSVEPPTGPGPVAPQPAPTGPAPTSPSIGSPSAPGSAPGSSPGPSPVATSAPASRVVTIRDSYLAYVVSNLSPPLSIGSLALLKSETIKFYEKIFTAKYGDKFAGLDITVNDVQYNAGKPESRFNLFMDFTPVVSFTTDPVPQEEDAFNTMTATASDYVTYITGNVRTVDGLSSTNEVKFAATTFSSVVPAVAPQAVKEAYVNEAYAATLVAGGEQGQEKSSAPRTVGIVVGTVVLSVTAATLLWQIRQHGLNKIVGVEGMETKGLVQ